MKTVVLREPMEYTGRIRRQGEVIVVPDSFTLGRTLSRNIEVKNRAITNQFRERSRRGKIEQDKLPVAAQKRA